MQYINKKSYRLRVAGRNFRARENLLKLWLRFGGGGGVVCYTALTQFKKKKNLANITKKVIDQVPDI